jgi:uncharacterized protein YggE
MKMLKLVIVSLALASGAALANGQEVDRSRESGPSIVVSGVGEVRHKPDMAEIEVGVVTEAETAAAAVESNNQKMTQLLESLRQQGLEEEDIQTSNFQVMPQHQYHPEGREPPRIAGYQVVNQVHIGVRDLAKLGEVLDAAVGQGANQIHAIQFSIRERNELVAQALRQALASARQKAEALVAEAGAELGPVLHIQEASSEAPQPLPGYAMRAQAAESVPISPGTLTIRAQVYVTYRLGGGAD